MEMFDNLVSLNDSYMQFFLNDAVLSEVCEILVRGPMVDETNDVIGIEGVVGWSGMGKVVRGSRVWGK